MPQNIKLWKITNQEKLKKISQKRVSLEKKLEDWIEKDISIISNDLLVIGRQVVTDLGGFIDLLCLDSQGDVVILELKRDKTPRKVVAQTLDYAAWVSKLSHEKISEIAEDYFKDKKSLEKAFEDQFKEKLPEVLNENHKGIIVASQVDNRTERIIQYLTDSYGVGINVVTFQFFKEKDTKYLSRVFLIEPSESERRNRRRAGNKRRSNLTFEELECLAEEKGIEQIYKKLVNRFKKSINYKKTTQSGIVFDGVNKNNKKLTIISFIPTKSNSDKGLFYRVYLDRFIKYFNLERKKAIASFPNYKKHGTNKEKWGGGEIGEGYFQDIKQVKKFLSTLRKKQ
jgi:hypothetical protein